MPDYRLLTGIARVDGKDHEDIGSDDWIHAAHSIDKVLPKDEGIWRPLNIPHFRWGGECRVEIDVSALAQNDNSVRVAGWSYFYEGASEDTGEEEDRTEIDFVVTRFTAAVPDPYVISYELRNATFIGAEDFATVTFQLKNIITEPA